MSAPPLRKKSSRDSGLSPVNLVYRKRNLTNKNMRDLHSEFVKYGKNAKYWLRRCAILLPEIAREEIWRKKGFGSIYEYAAKLAGMSKAMVDTALWVMKKVEDKPELQKIVEDKGINIVRPIANLATKETAAFWAKKAEEMSKHTLEIYAKEYREQVCPGANLEKIEMNLDPKVANQLKKMKGDRDWNTFMKELMDGQAKPEPVKTESPYIPVAIKKHVATKTNGLCAHPNCNKPATEFHHTKRFSLVGEHNPDYITPLCKAHHNLAHLGLIANEEKQPYEWQLLTFPDQTNPKYEVDKLVQAYKT